MNHSVRKSAVTQSMGQPTLWLILAMVTTGAVCIAAEEEGSTAGVRTAQPLGGPIHEAFLQPLEGAGSPGATVASAPSAPLRDYPAAIRPSAKTAVWIPGYWAWDERAAGFAWVVGVWRIPPPGMRWVPGYWSRSEDGWRWVRGFWSPHDQPRLVYLPPPPPPPGEPELAQLDGNQFAVAGYWSYSAGRYVWNRGFKARRKQGWVWTPTRHQWSPAGSLLLPGYWDYETTRRGVLFAPLPSVTTQTLAAGAGPLVPKAAVNLALLPEVATVGASYGHDYLDLAEPDVGDLTLPVSALAARLPAGAQPVSEIAPESLPQIAQAAERVRLLAVQRSKFESNAAGERTDAALTFYLPPPAEPVNPRPAQTSPGESASEYVPGLAGRRVPGARGRSVPGISGRTVPGVDTRLPGVVGPGGNDE
ncbi:MAG TPA: YXWGXW repeat-containing protein [Pirellulales bacterium]|nr:YXWGXW repeat-containing protein [Pirellulales bacterium]